MDLVHKNHDPTGTFDYSSMLTPSTPKIGEPTEKERKVMEGTLLLLDTPEKEEKMYLRFIEFFGVIRDDEPLESTIYTKMTSPSSGMSRYVMSPVYVKYVTLEDALMYPLYRELTKRHQDRLKKGVSYEKGELDCVKLEDLPIKFDLKDNRIHIDLYSPSGYDPYEGLDEGVFESSGCGNEQ